MEGYSCGSAGADGDFGQGTYDAVRRFQQEVGLTADGIVGDETWNAIVAVTGENGNPFLLKKGDTGANVKSLQTKLIARGYSCGSAGADGDFGQGTYDAIIKFQRALGLDVDGIAGPATLSAINGSVAATILRSGSKGALVKELQEKLIAKGYTLGSADGDFGQATFNAVISFQSTNGLSADGIVGPMTWDALNGLQYNTLLRLGSKGSAVSELQKKLIAKGYSIGADGDFGYATYKAVISFQASNGLDQDGVVGPSTWSVLNGINNNINNNTLLKLGSKGSAVKSLQQLLIQLGYNLGSAGADGDFGQATYNAVRSFQSKNGLAADGVVGAMTWNALYGLSGNGGSVVGGSAGVRKFLEVAKSQIGYKEGYVNITKYGAWYGNNGAYWCAQFVSWCANESGILGSIVPTYQSCELGANWYRSRGRYRLRMSGYLPVPGDIVFFRDAIGFYDHTGIVEYVSGGIVHTIEGNKNDSVCRVSHNLTESGINGYGANGGLIDGIDTVLKQAGCVGMFTGHPIDFPGFSKETPLGILSLIPLVTVRGAVSYSQTIINGGSYTVGSTSVTGASASITKGFASAGIGLDFSQQNIVNTLQSINISMKVGDNIKYSLAMKASGIMEITLQHKVNVLGKDIYQSIIIRIEKSFGQPAYIPIVATSAQASQVVDKGNTTAYLIGGLTVLAIGLFLFQPELGPVIAATLKAISGKLVSAPI